ncbi:MAG: DUF433 domain-containing protein [Salinimicrobium sp.]
MENLLERITIDPDLCGGKPTVRGTRMTVQTILEYLGAGDAKEEILEQYPFLEPEDINACLKFASSVMDNNFEVKELNG